MSPFENRPFASYYDPRTIPKPRVLPRSGTHLQGRIRWIWQGGEIISRHYPRVTIRGIILRHESSVPDRPLPPLPLMAVGGAGARWLALRVKAWFTKHPHYPIHLCVAQPGRAPVRHYHPDGHSTRPILQRQGTGKQDRSLRRARQRQSLSLQVDRNRRLKYSHPTTLRLYLWDATPGGHARHP